MQVLLLLPVSLVVGYCAVMSIASAQDVCTGCSAFALFVVSSSDTLYVIALQHFDVSGGLPTLQSLNNLSDPDQIKPGQRLYIPFHCDCLSLSHNFSYSALQGDTVITIATNYYGNLTTAEAIDKANPGIESIQPMELLTIPINCSCGNSSVSYAYGLFGTYAAQPNDTLSSLSLDFNISQDLLRRYNPAISFDPLQPFVSILFIPLTNSSGQYPPYVARLFPDGGGSSSRGIIIGAVVGGGFFFLVLGLGIWYLRSTYLRKLQNLFGKDKGCTQSVVASGSASKNQTKFNNNAVSEKGSNNHGAFPADYCINFSYDELAAATDNFSLSKQIGKGGYATVYYGEWQGQKLAVKRMDMKETREFSNELAILSSVHHANLVDLIGYCTKGYLFLVYEYVDNGTLAHHLRSGTEPMRWSTRVQIALDAARGIEYMHDHTRPTYIHRDLKPNNILIDSNFHAKVGDFGLTRLMDPDGDGWTKTFNLHGTYGYMAPEYAQFGQISVKLDIYAFGVILFQLVSGRDALVGPSDHLLSLFEEVLIRTNAEESFKSLVDPALGTDYPIESVWKMVTLAARCTQKDPDLRPQMREVVMQLMMLSDVGDHMEFQA